jgi:hypothetical protein
MIEIKVLEEKSGGKALGDAGKSSDASQQIEGNKDNDSKQKESLKKIDPSQCFISSYKDIRNDDHNTDQNSDAVVEIEKRGQQITHSRQSSGDVNGVEDN